MLNFIHGQNFAPKTDISSTLCSYLAKSREAGQGAEIDLKIAFLVVKYG